MFVAPSAYPLGGVAVWLDYLILGLEKMGWNVELALVSGRYHDVRVYSKAYPNLKKLVEINNPTGSREGRVNSLANAIYNEEPDLVIAVNIPDTYESINRLRDKKRNSPKVIMAIHGIQPDLLDDIAEYSNVLDAVVCTNKLTMRLAEKDAGMEASRLFYAPYGVDMINQESNKNKPGKKLRIAWVGRLEQAQKRARDIPTIITALQKNGVKFEIIIAGGGPEEEYIRKSLEDQGLLKYVIFLGVVPPEKMQSNVYNNCDLLLVTSYWETGPIIIWEAMASSTPVVTSRYIGSGLEGSLVDGENCLFFDIADCEAAARQISKLGDKELYHRLVHGGQELVNRRYNKEVSVSGWHKAFEEILKLPTQHYTSLIEHKPNGRLDKLFGLRLGECVRSAFGVSFQHASSGGEWPHSYGSRKIDDHDFWVLAESMDKRKAG